MTLANAVVQVQHAFPGAPQSWDTPDGSMPYRVLMAYLGMLPAAQAMDRMSAARVAAIGHGGEYALRLSEEDADMAFPS